MKAIIVLTALLIAVTSTAEPIRVTVDGKQWDIGMKRGSYAKHAATLAKQPWFGHKTLARKFLIAHQGYNRDTAVHPKYPNFGGNRSLWFAYYDVNFKDLLSYHEMAAAVYQSENNYECILDDLNRPYNEIDPASCRLFGNTVIDPWHCDDEDQMYCYWAVATPVRVADFSITPATGRYSRSGTMDIVFNGLDGERINTLVTYDGIDITEIIEGCLQRVDDRTLACKNVSWSSFENGQHTVFVHIDLDTGEQVSDLVTWTVY